MIRKTLTAAIAVAVLMLSALTLDADAVRTCSYDLAQIPGICAQAEVYPGPFTGDMPPSPQGPYGFGTLQVYAGVPGDGVPADGAAGTGGGAAPLAVTGSESTVLGYVGTGLIAFGAVAMGSRRKFFQGALD